MSNLSGPQIYLDTFAKDAFRNTSSTHTPVVNTRINNDFLSNYYRWDNEANRIGAKYNRMGCYYG
ncbi:hypothetical protein LBMAG25_07910 [Bacteroidota bacterium]|nr:hypothetical protein LBMAG25_07910 [Bacteroidota bacterium]